MNKRIIIIGGEPHVGENGVFTPAPTPLDPSRSLGYFERLRALWRVGFTNQGHSVKMLTHTDSRQRTRRARFVQRNTELIEQYGYNLPRKVRRRIAWDSVGAR